MRHRCLLPIVLGMGTENQHEVVSATEDVAITDDDINSISVAAVAHPKTVLRRLLGLEVRGNAGRRVDTELERRGFVRRPLVVARPSAA